MRLFPIFEDGLLSPAETIAKPRHISTGRYTRWPQPGERLVAWFDTTLNVFDPSLGVHKRKFRGEEFWKPSLELPVNFQRMFKLSQLLGSLVGQCKNGATGPDFCTRFWLTVVYVMSHASILCVAMCLEWS